MSAMENVITFEAGSKILANRLRQGLKPLIRIEVKLWKQFHVVTLLARLESADRWQEVAMTTEPIKHVHTRKWDSTALEMWEDLVSAYVGRVRQAYLTQHLSHMMFTYEVEITEVKRKKDLMP